MLPRFDSLHLLYRLDSGFCDVQMSFLRGAAAASGRRFGGLVLRAITRELEKKVVVVMHVLGLE